MKTIRLDGLRVGRRTDVEGSRGGKVIGHTSSGKPIYESHKKQGHKDFSAKDHEEAAEHHRSAREYHAWSKDTPSWDSGSGTGGNSPGSSKTRKAQKAHSHHHEQVSYHENMAQRKKSGMK